VGAADLDVGMARLTAAGELDLTFGTNGRATFNAGGTEVIEDAVQDAAGGVLVIGRTSSPGFDLLIGRLNPDGTLDSNFGSSGWIIIDTGTAEIGKSIAIDPATQDVIAVGEINGETTMLLRYTSAGQPAAGFGTSGRVSHDLNTVGGGFELPHKVIVTGGDLLLVSRIDGTVTSMGVARFTGAGALVTGFGTQGQLLVDRATFGLGITPAFGGGWYVGGFTNGAVVIARITDAGAVDTSFGTSGYFESTLATGVTAAAFPRKLMTDSAGRLLMIGSVTATGDDDLCVARVTP
jgi:uncharacterized delta-60 repeat protein